MKNSDMKIGYIAKAYTVPDNKLVWKFKEANYTRTINSRGDKIKCKLFYGSLDYDEVESNTKIMKDNTSMILVQEPFFLDDELRVKVERWVEWANSVEPSEYDPFIDNGNPVSSVN